MFSMSQFMIIFPFLSWDWIALSSSRLLTFDFSRNMFLFIVAFSAEVVPVANGPFRTLSAPLLWGIWREITTHIRHAGGERDVHSTSDVVATLRYIFDLPSIPCRFVQCSICWPIRRVRWMGCILIEFTQNNHTTSQFGYVWVHLSHRVSWRCLPHGHRHRSWNEKQKSFWNQKFEI